MTLETLRTADLVALAVVFIVMLLRVSGIIPIPNRWSKRRALLSIVLLIVSGPFATIVWRSTFTVRTGSTS